MFCEFGSRNTGKTISTTRRSVKRKAAACRI